MNRNQTLDTAKAAVNRAPKSYGNPLEHFERVARHWNAHLAGRGFLMWPEQPMRLQATDVAIMLGQVKIARLEHDPQHEDSWCDWAGYAACGAEVSEPRGYGASVTWTGDVTAQYAVPRWRFLDGGVEIPPQEPAWKRAKVGDRIRIREGAESWGGIALPREAVVLFALGGEVRDEWVLSVQVGSHSCLVRANSVLEILPPLPESKFGFTVGETVNYVGCPKGSTPGKVTGFSDVGVNVRWSNGGKWDDCGPSLLRHGA